MSIDILKQLFERHFGAPAISVLALPGNLGASGRNILRLSGAGHSAIGILYGVRKENLAFVEFSRHFRRHGLPVPEIYGDDLDHNAYLEEDLGNTTLFEFLSKNRDGENIAPAVIEAYRKAIAVLPRFQVEAGRTLDYQFAYPRASFDRQSIAWDLNYFKYYFLRLAGIDFNEQGLEDDFQTLTEFLLAADREYFLYRDFQSRNIMLRDGEPWFLDYQGGRKGALQYDIASLLYDAKADLPPNVRQHLLEYYLDELAKHIALDREEFLRYYYGYVLCAHHAGLGRVRLSRILRTQAALPAEHSLCAEEPALAVAECRAANRSSRVDGRLPRDARLRQAAELQPTKVDWASGAHLQLLVSSWRASAG